MKVEKIKKIVENGRSYLAKQYGDTSVGVIWVTKILISVLLGFYIGSGIFPDFPDEPVIVFAIGLVFLIITLFQKIFIFFALVIKKINLVNGIFSFILFLLIVFLSLMTYGNFLPTVIFGVLFVIILTLFARSIVAIIKNKIRTGTTVCSTFFLFILTFLLCYFMISDGFADDTLINMSDWKINLTRNEHELKKDVKTYEVKTITYGLDSEDMLPSTTIDLTAEIGGYHGITALIRNAYWGYGITEVPLSGKVWYPKEDGNFPVVFIIHGNHMLTTPSYYGYGYLGEYLASMGYVVISVDENFCNGYIDMGLTGENDARAILLLENMKQLRTYNEKVGNPLYHKMDYENIGLAGHSRGGEAVSIAALFNQYNEYPENGTIKLNYHFQIKTIIAIAPTCDQYRPTNKDVKLKDINYFLVHGSNDQDVSNCMGIKQYENVTFSKGSEYQKGYLYIASANHGQFNTEWGKYDMGSPLSFFLNTKSLLEGSEQREILKEYMKICLDVTLKKKTENIEFLKNNQLYQGNMPRTVYIQGFEDSSFVPICDFEEDTNLRTGTANQVLLEGTQCATWSEKAVPYSNNEVGDTGNHALYLWWEDTLKAKYNITLNGMKTQMEDGNNGIQFNIMNREEVANNSSQGLDCMITLRDKEGNVANLTLKNYYVVYPPLPIKLSKLDYISNEIEFKYNFQTIRIPFSEFEKINSQLNCNELDELTFEFNQSKHGKVMLDNIGFAKVE